MTKSARSVAINFLARREHGVEELKTKLSNKGCPTEEIESVINDLLAENLLSEERFVESYCRSRSNRGFGPIAIKNELRAKKIDESVIEKIMAQMKIDWDDLLENVFQKKYSSVDFQEAKEKASCWRFLSQRGFSSEQISRLLKL